MENPINEMVVCDCGAHAIQVYRDDEDDTTSIIFWAADGYACRVWTLVERVKAIWKMLRCGRFNYHDIILRSEEREKLVRLLTDMEEKK